MKKVDEEMKKVDEEMEDLTVMRSLASSNVIRTPRSHLPTESWVHR